MSPWTKDPGSAPPTVDDPVRPGDVWSTRDTAQLPAAPPLQPPHQPPPPPPLPSSAAAPAPRPVPSGGGNRALRAVAAVAVAVGLLGGGAALGRLLDEETPTAQAPSSPRVGSTIPVERRAPATTEPRTSTTSPATTTPPPSLDPSLEPVVAAAKAAKPAVVQIETATGLGSGFVFTEDGYVLTAAHVVTDSSRVAIRLGDGSGYEGQVVGVNGDTDVAVVKVVDPPADLPVAALALDDAPEVGQQVIAIGSPFGLDQTVTAGIVSTVNRPVQVGPTNVVGMIQTDAPINSGNSGGALVDLQGRVIGINDQIRTTSGANVGIGFAIPIDLAYDVAQLLIQGQPVEFGYLGVTTDEPSFGQSGALVTQVMPDSPAAQAGLAEGDVITALDGRSIRSFEELISGVRSRRPGEMLELTVLRGEEEFVVEVVLAASTR